jgi:alanine dehydrogenase
VGASIHLRFLSADDVERLKPDAQEAIAAVEDVVRAQGEGRVVLEPRVHLEPGAQFRGHWNVLRAYVSPLRAAGVKVVGEARRPRSSTRRC